MLHVSSGSMSRKCGKNNMKFFYHSRCALYKIQQINKVMNQLKFDNFNLNKIESMNKNKSIRSSFDGTRP